VVERRTDVEHGRGVIRTATVWAYLDPESMRPASVPTWFDELYGEVTPDRKVSHRLRLGPPPAATRRRPWPLRVTDYDVLGHVNNAIAWAAIEDALDQLPGDATPVRAEVEYAAAIDIGSDVELVTKWSEPELAVWIVADGTPCVAAVIAVR